METSLMKRLARRAPQTLKISAACGFALLLANVAGIQTTQNVKAGTTAAICITDTHTGDNIVFTLGGNYTFTQCNPGFTITGVGVVSTHSSEEPSPSATTRSAGSASPAAR